nr:MAG TPA: hypothetical protein [Caudoviricetes sp.]
MLLTNLSHLTPHRGIKVPLCFNKELLTIWKCNLKIRFIISYSGLPRNTTRFILPLDTKLVELFSKFCFKLRSKPCLVIG